MKYKKKLIEVALPLDAINPVSAREKSIRHGHPSTLHLWWARRPLAAARAVLWTSLVDDPSAHPDKFPTEEDQEKERRRLFDILEELVKWENSNNERVLAAARKEIEKSTDGALPAILDPFCGGGTIPLEAQRLGLKSLGGDLNPVPVLITKAMVEVVPRFGGRSPVNPDSRHDSSLHSWDRGQGLADDVRYFGKLLKERAFEQIGHLYPPVRDSNGNDLDVAAWIWARTVRSPNPAWAQQVPLVRSWTLLKHKGKPTAWVEPVIDETEKTITYRIRTEGQPPPATVGRGGGRCLVTGVPIPFGYIADEAKERPLDLDLIALICRKDGRLEATAPTADQRHIAASATPPWSPSTDLPDKALGFRVQRYGLKHHADLFTTRQLTALSTFSLLIDDVRREVEALAQKDSCFGGIGPLRDGGSGALAYSEAIATFLAFAVNRSTDYWSTLTVWAGTFIAHTFGRNALPMVWDFAEANPFGSSSGCWDNAIDWIARVIERLPGKGDASIEQRDAKARILECPGAIICTDPPYYDNVPYADLSDYFYVWLRKNLSEVWPDETSTLLTPKREELIAEPHRHGSYEEATDFFEAGMSEVFAAAAKSQNPLFPLTVFYAFKQAETTDIGEVSTGWESFLEGLLQSGLAIERTWPLRTERPGRLRDIGSGALATSIVLVCRPRSLAAGLATRSEFLAELQKEIPGALRLLQRENIAPVDLAQSAIGPGMAVFSRFSKVVEADGSAMTVRTALGLINEILQEALSEEETEFDGDTRWALTWFEQHGMNPGRFGDADTLSKAKDTSVSGVAIAGIVENRDGKVRLLDREELDPDWDPTTDRRLTVWEVTQHLIRRLEQSEIDAAALLRTVGLGYGERARQLAYLLYGICERKSWAKEAVAYNGLIVAWPELARLAAGSPDEPVQRTLGDEEWQ